MKTIRTRFLFYSLLCGILATLITSTVLAKTPTSWQTAINVPESSPYTGKGVLVGILDNGVKTGNSLLSANFKPEYPSKYFSQGIKEDNGDESVLDYGHGTPVAGCVLGNGTANSYGLATNATLASLSILVGASQYVSDIANAFKYDYDGTANFAIKNNSWGETFGFSPSGNSVFTALYENASTTAFVFSSGNSRRGTVQIGGVDYAVSNTRDANKRGEQAFADTIVVAATQGSGYGEFAYFSCYGANVFVTAPGVSIPTAARGGGVSSFSGTSASAPVVSGALALAVEALPDDVQSSTRLLKHLLVETSNSNLYASPTDRTAKWITNKAGNDFSPSYGFGQVDVAALIAAAEKATGVTEQTVQTIFWENAGTDGIGGTPVVDTVTELIPSPGIFYSYQRSENRGGLTDYSHGIKNTRLAAFGSVEEPLTSNYTTHDYVLGENTPLGDISGMAHDAVGTLFYTAEAYLTPAMFAGTTMQPFEEIGITVGVSANFLGDLEIVLKAPGGTESTICFAEGQATNVAGLVGTGMVEANIPSDGGDIWWTFTTNAFWGEEFEEGLWTLEFYDYDSTSPDSPAVYANSISSTFYMGQVQPLDVDPPPDGNGVPEPATWGMLVCGLVLVWRWRRKDQ